MTERQRGLIASVVDTLLWASTVLYWPHLKPSGDAEILAQRLVWACVSMMALLALTGRLGSFRRLLADRRATLLLAGAAVSITTNWAGFIWGVNHDHVVEASLGFFIGPLVTVLLGVLALREPVRPWQLTAIGLVVVAVGVDSAAYGKVPWFALMLALSGGLYGLFKKQASAGALESLAVEMTVVAPFALAFLIADAGAGHSTFFALGPGHTLLLMGGGLVTVTPLIFFGYAAPRVSLVLLGIIGYLAPLAIFVLGLAYFHEHFPASQLTGYVLVWVALVVFTIDSAVASATPPEAAADGTERLPARQAQP
jgi:chloramphenicol-sensitive protein RarD